MKKASLFLRLLLCFCLGLALASPVLAQEEPPLLNVLVRGKTMAQAAEAVINAVNSNNYSFVRQQAIDSRLVPADWEARSVRIVYFCNFDTMNRALALDTRATEFLPCRITLIETRDGIELITVNPAWLSLRMGNYRLHEYCVKMKADYLTIMNEAAL